jgi:hypothetical protein
MNNKRIRISFFTVRSYHARLSSLANKHTHDASLDLDQFRNDPGIWA